MILIFQLRSAAYKVYVSHGLSTDWREWHEPGVLKGNREGML